MQVKDVIKYLKTLPPNLKVTIEVGDYSNQREVYMVENDCRGQYPRVVFHPGRRIKKNCLR